MIEQFTRYILKIREVLNNIKTRFFELDKLTFGFTLEQKDKYLMLWVQNSKKMTGQIWKTADEGIQARRAGNEVTGGGYFYRLL